MQDNEDLALGQATQNRGMGRKVQRRNSRKKRRTKKTKKPKKPKKSKKTAKKATNPPTEQTTGRKCNVTRIKMVAILMEPQEVQGCKGSRNWIAKSKLKVWLNG